VRGAEGQEIVLHTWGRSSGFCVDPIEKKPLYHWLPGSAVLSFGTAGCNLACRFCQNWSISTSRAADTLADEAPPEAIATAARGAGAHSVAFTYNDPVVFLEYAAACARACRALGVGSVAVTAGYVLPEARQELFADIDAANVDLKSFREEFYWRTCGGHLEPVLDTLRWLVHESSVWVEITTLLIPGKNDGDDEIDDLARFVAGELGPHVPLHFSAFHPDWKMLDVGPTPLRTLRRARDIALARGVRHVYTGNVVDAEGAATWCPGCRSRLIGREGYRITDWALQPGGRCGRCGHTLAGRWEDEPGRWGGGRRRLSIVGRG
jgi:pyruvate formate lyase activating enzyme